MEMSTVDKQVVERWLELEVSLGIRADIVERICLRSGLPKGRVLEILNNYLTDLKNGLWV